MSEIKVHRTGYKVMLSCICKESKKQSWFRKGGLDVPMIVPTQGGQMAKRMKQKESEKNQGRNVRFLIMERGGVNLDKKLRRSNSWSGVKCGRPRCFACRGDKGGYCWREGVM